MILAWQARCWDTRIYKTQMEEIFDLSQKSSQWRCLIDALMLCFRFRQVSLSPRLHFLRLSPPWAGAACSDLALSTSHLWIFLQQCMIRFCVGCRTNCKWYNFCGLTTNFPVCTNRTYLKMVVLPGTLIFQIIVHRLIFQINLQAVRCPVRFSVTHDGGHCHFECKPVEHLRRMAGLVLLALLQCSRPTDVHVPASNR